MAVQAKALVDCIDDEPPWWGSKLGDYQKSPASAFLREAVHISDAVNQCKRRFMKKNDGTFNKDSQDSLYRLGAAAFSSMMSHFETFERSLFAGMLEGTHFVSGFRLEECRKRLQQDSLLALDINRLLAYRGRTAPIGQLVADSIGSWHNPVRVNAHFKTVLPDFQLFSGTEADDLDVLWQLRHSIVHTAGWLTHADAQKLRFLAKLADRPILLNPSFVEAVARRFHLIVGRATTAVGTKFMTKVALLSGSK